MAKRISSLLLIIFLGVCLASCSNRQILLFLNWGEYIDESLIEAFEEKENCTVVMDLGESNEIFYSKISGGTTLYDVVCPSDYMVEKLYNNDMLLKLDFQKLPTYRSIYNSNGLLSGVNSIMNMMESDCEGISSYFVPYLWGTWGIMYSTLNPGLEEAVTNNENEWASLFDRSVLPANTKVAMYDSHQHAYYAACQYLGLDYSSGELGENELDQIFNLVKNMKFDAWGTDNIKKDIVAKNIDVGFMWTGDFLYYYCETIANKVIDAYLNKDIDVDDFNTILQALLNKEVYTSNGNSYEVGFDIFIPQNTIAFCDNLVITKDAQHQDLAYKFIDFLCSNSVIVDDVNLQPAYQNTYYVCYNTPFVSVYDEITSLSANTFNNDDINNFNLETKNGVDPYDSTLYYKLYDFAIGEAFKKYYPKDENKGNILHPFSRNYVNIINRTFNNARA